MKRKVSLISYKEVTGGVLRSTDLVLICAGYALATRIAAFLSTRQMFNYPSPEEWNTLPMTLLPITLICWSLITGYSDTYVSHRDEGLAYLRRGLLKTMGLWAIASLGLVFLAKLRYTSRQLTLEFLACSSVLLIVRQVATVLLLRRLRQSGYDQKTAILIGDKNVCDRFVRLASRSHPMGYEFIHAVIDASGEIVAEGHLGRVRATLADEIFIIGPTPRLEDSEDSALHLLKSGKSLHIVPEVVDARLFRQSLGEIGGMPVLSISGGKLTWLELFAKRAFDVVGAALLIVLCLPLWLVTTVLVKLTSPGPVLFRQTRLGKNGRRFTMFKFRTMRADAERMLAESRELYEQYVLNNYKFPQGRDPRLTRIGGVLRALSIDELPQLLNVLRGEMSLVGPRPIVPAEIEKYEEFAPLFLSVKPGLTGHWQVNGRSEVKEYGRRVELDLEYIRDQSMRTDFGILLRTVPTVLRRKGAY
jgi:exopolysaccharide biosynthesis polyprenyl glycosylphosphotransferase